MDMFRLLYFCIKFVLARSCSLKKFVPKDVLSEEPKSDVPNKHHSRTNLQAWIPACLGPDRDHAFHLHLGVIKRREHLQRPFEYY